MTLYCLVLHVLVVTLSVIIIWQIIATQRKHIKEADLVKKYRPSMQRMCDDLGVRVQIDDFEDLLDAYEKITTKVTSTVPFDD